MEFVSFTFGLPSALEVDALHAVGSALIGTVTNVEEALAAVDLPIVAAGAIHNRASLDLVLNAGACAGQIGTAPLRAAAAAQNNAEGLNLWAGEAWQYARSGTVAEILARFQR
ncbi:hypothetical protein ACQQCD_00670 [Pseudarthrobacter sp. J1763]|uniref:hypothetical protein n=1 Tax=Pseudarthrobacter sp. J1763 TaxID=3420445 RepID=UPI003D2CA823